MENGTFRQINEQVAVSQNKLGTWQTKCLAYDLQRMATVSKFYFVCHVVLAAITVKSLYSFPVRNPFVIFKTKIVHKINSYLPIETDFP